MSSSNPRSRLVAVLIALAAPLSLLACDGPSAASADADGVTGVSVAQAGLSGTWRVNPELSDPPPIGRRPGHRDSLPGDRPGPGGDRRPGAPGGPAGGHRPGAPGGPAGPLSIVDDGDRVTFSRGDRPPHTIEADGETRTLDLPRGGAVEVRAYRSGDSLVVERTSERVSSTATWEVSGDRLTHTVRGSAPDGTAFERAVVFDRV